MRAATRAGVAAVLLVFLSGCIAIDFPVKGAVFINRTNEAVVFYVEGTDLSAVVQRGEYRIPGTEAGCVGTGIVATTADGTELASFDGATCEETTLVLYEDGSVTVTDKWGSNETRAPRERSG